MSNPLVSIGLPVVKANYLKDAIDALAKNETPKVQETKSIGCTIKRVE